MSLWPAVGCVIVHGMWWTASVADTVVSIPDHPGLLQVSVSSMPTRDRDRAHGSVLDGDEHDRLESVAMAYRRRWRFWIDGNETGVVVTPHAAGVSAYWSDRAETKALARVLDERADDHRPRETGAVGPMSGVLVAIRTSDHHTAITRRSRACDGWAGCWGVSAGETLAPSDVVDGRLDPERATLRAIDEELAIPADALIEAEAVGLVRASSRSAHHLVTVAHLDMTAAEVAAVAPTAADAWEWDRLELLPVDQVGRRIDRARRVIPAAVGALAFCFEPARLRPSAA